MARKKIEENILPVATAHHSEDLEKVIDQRVKAALEKRELSPEKVYRYPEIENEHVQVIPFGVGTGAHQTYQQLTKMDKHPVFIPEEFGGKQTKGIPRHRVQMNDLILWIDKGYMVMVPDEIAKILIRSMDDTSRALNPMLIDGDGRLVSADLSKKPQNGEFSR